MLTGHGYIKAYLYNFKIKDSPMCKRGEQTIHHILFNCELVEQDTLKAPVQRSENWPVSKDILINKFCKNVKIFTDSQSLDKL